MRNCNFGRFLILGFAIILCLVLLLSQILETRNESIGKAYVFSSENPGFHYPNLELGLEYSLDCNQATVKLKGSDKEYGLDQLGLYRTLNGILEPRSKKMCDGSDTCEFGLTYSGKGISHLDACAKNIQGMVYCVYLDFKLPTCAPYSDQ